MLIITEKKKQKLEEEMAALAAQLSLGYKYFILIIYDALPS
jgi:hypothetical protein